jgi:virulence factor Mce-like protein
MRRLAAIAALAIAAAALAGASGGDKAGTYRIDAIFDSAGFLTPGVDVRIGGARVGKVRDLTLTRDHKARVEMDVESRFAPFRADADCNIQPQSLISEKFVECAPGTPAAPALRPAGGLPATVPVTGTHAPVDVDLVLNIFDRPVRERLTLLLDALGSGFAGRGEDLDAAIRRAAPALNETRRVLDVLNADRAQLQRLIADSDVVLDRLAAGRGRVAAFVRSAGHVASTSGRRRARLAEAVRRLPPLLAQARPRFAELTRFARLATPFSDRLREAGPGLRRLTEQLAPFARQVTPGVVRLGTTARRVSPALPDIAPQVRRLRRFASAGRPAGALAAELNESLREQGAVEGTFNIFYWGATALARFDRYSHILPAYNILTACSTYGTTPNPDCDSHYASWQAPSVTRTPRRDTSAKAAPPAPAAAPQQPAGRAPERAPEAPRIRVPEVRPPGLKLPDLPKPPQGEPLTGLLDYLLR